MLIRNARIKGYSGLTDLRLMHGAVQEIGVGLVKGLYESELNLNGDEVRPCPPDMPLPSRFRRNPPAGEEGPVRPGTTEPLTRWKSGEFAGFLHSRSAD